MTPAYDFCRTAADVWAQAAHVQAWRSQVAAAAASVGAEGVPTAPSPAAILVTLPDQSTAVPGRISVHRVLEVTAEYFGTTVPELLSHCRKQPLCRRRQVAMYVARRLTGRGLPFIALHMGGRHHTTILHGVRVMQARIDRGDSETIAAVNEIVTRLQTVGGAHD